MHHPKYSIVLPVLNGAETIPITLGHLLSIDYSDFEVVVSDNLSSDGTDEILNGFDDPRLKVVRPSKRLGWSQSLAFAYTHATGFWQSHIGDDDVVMPSRFAILDQLLEINPDADVLWCRSFRYFWPSYGERSLANFIDPITFSGTYTTLSETVRDCVIRGTRVDGGQCFIISHEVIKRCHERYGFYVSSQHGEAFSARAALINAQKISILDLPLGIMGRHSKSVGTQHLQSKEHYLTKGETDIAHSDPEDFLHTPWKYKGYISWSLDALCLLIKLEQRVPALSDSEWLSWGYLTWGDIRSLTARGQISVADDFVIRSLEKYHKNLVNVWKDRNFDKIKDFMSVINANSFWPDPANTLSIGSYDKLTSIPVQEVNSWGVENISQLAYMLERKLPLRYGYEQIAPKIRKMSHDSVLAARFEEFITWRKNAIINQDLLHTSTYHLSRSDKSCTNSNPEYAMKYIEFAKGLQNYYFREGNRCNAPIAASYEFEDISSLHNHIDKYMQRTHLPVPNTKLINGVSEKYDSLLAKLCSQKNRYKDLSAIIIGNGPSQEMLDYESLELFKNKGNHVYTVNLFTSNDSFPKHCVTHYVTSDYQLFSSTLGEKLASKRDLVFRFLDEYKPELFLPIERDYDIFHTDWNVTYFEDRHRAAWEGGGWKPDKPRRYWSNTLLKALAIARYIGYKHVYFIGADTSYPQCIRSTPDNDLAIVESHASIPDSLTQGYPLSTSMSKYMALLSYWFWSYGYICDSRFINLDPLSLVDSATKVDSTMTEAWNLLDETAQGYVHRVLTSYNNRDMTPV